MATWTWIGGWASDLSCWRDRLASLYPGAQHEFLNAHRLLDPAVAAREIGVAAARSEAVLAWSMGSLVLHRVLVDAARDSSPAGHLAMLPPDSPGAGEHRPRFLSLSPVFDFCRPGGPWPPVVLKRMAARLETDRSGTMAGFWELMTGGTTAGRQWEEEWRVGSAAYSLADLQSGLDFLRETVVSPVGLSRWKHDLILLADPRDPVAPAWDGEPGGACQVRRHAGGHLPFLMSPEVIREAVGHV